MWVFVHRLLPVALRTVSSGVSAAPLPHSRQECDRDSSSCTFLRESTSSIFGPASPPSGRTNPVRGGPTTPWTRSRTGCQEQVQQTVDRLKGLGGVPVFEDYPALSPGRRGRTHSSSTREPRDAREAVRAQASEKLREDGESLAPPTGNRPVHARQFCARSAIGARAGQGSSVGS